MKKKTIKLKASTKGSLHKALGVPNDEKIPLAKEEKAKHSKNPALRKKANFAINFRGAKRKGRKGRA